jgi:hypothetical protein
LDHKALLEKAVLKGSLLGLVWNSALKPQFVQKEGRLEVHMKKRERAITVLRDLQVAQLQRAVFDMTGNRIWWNSH